MIRLHGIVGIVLFLAVWEVAGRHFGNALLAPPTVVVRELPETLMDPDLWSALGRLLAEMGAGYLLAMLVGVPLGIGMGRSWLIDSIVHPWANLFVVTSVAALVPLFMVVLGRGVAFRISLVFVATVWYVALTVVRGASAVPQRLLKVSRSFGSSGIQEFFLVVLPALTPYLLIAARIGLTHALRAAVTAEMFVKIGFGGMVIDAGLDMSTANLLGMLVILAVISTGATVVLDSLARRAAPWYESRIEAR